MGEVIHRRAARDKIMEDVRTTLTGARARAAAGNGGPWASAETRLVPVLNLWDTTLDKAKAARAELAPLEAAADATNSAVDDGLRGTADTIWNELGRPSNDPYFEILFPGGTGFYVDAPLADQPLLMEQLAELLDARLHPRLANAPAHAEAVRTAAAKLEAAAEAVRKPATRVAMLDRMLTSIARSAQVELASLKRLWKSEGLSEADIHSVIPDRPRNYGGQAPEPTP
jgi:hypothetical protein